MSGKRAVKTIKVKANSLGLEKLPLKFSCKSVKGKTKSFQRKLKGKKMKWDETSALWFRATKN